MIKLLVSYYQCRSGVTAIEYGIIVAAVALSISAALFLIGADFSSVVDAIGEATQNAVEEMSVEE